MLNPDPDTRPDIRQVLNRTRTLLGLPADIPAHSPEKTGSSRRSGSVSRTNRSLSYDSNDSGSVHDDSNDEESTRTRRAKTIDEVESLLCGLRMSLTSAFVPL
jgi:hypothetical protein